MNKKCYYKAYSKINLALDVLGRRPNGYHEVRMVMQTLDLYDELWFERIADGDEAVTLTANNPLIPTDEHNLICKAVRLMEEVYGFKAHLHIKLKKNIPVEAGMAGGSTDCAAALKAVNYLYELGADEKKLRELGVRLGADVPYCVIGGTALSEGIGEILTVLPDMPECHILVVKPPVGVSTKEVYGGLHLEEIKEHPRIDEMLSGIEEGSIKKIAGNLKNVLELVTIPMHPVISDIKEIMIKEGALNAVMSGSGPTVFGIFENEERAKKAAQCVYDIDTADEIFITKPVGNETVYNGGEMNEIRLEHR